MPVSRATNTHKVNLLLCFESNVPGCACSDNQALKVSTEPLAVGRPLRLHPLCGGLDHTILLLLLLLLQHCWQLLAVAPVYSPQMYGLLAASLGDDVGSLTGWLCSRLQPLTPCLCGVGALTQTASQLRQRPANSLCAE